MLTSLKVFIQGFKGEDLPFISMNSVLFKFDG